jgi:hypothetical protein
MPCVAPRRVCSPFNSSERRVSSPPPWPKICPASALSEYTSTRVHGFSDDFDCFRYALMPSTYSSMSRSSARPSAPRDFSAAVCWRLMIASACLVTVTVFSPVTSEKALTPGASRAAMRPG